MRKVSFLFALMIPFLFLSGCLSGGESQKLLDLALTVRGEYLAMTRCAARAAELRAVAAFPTGREDLLRAFNRLSSFLYLIMVQLKKEL